MIHTALISAIALSLSFVAEFILGYPPCFLCWMQRALWTGLLLAALVGIMVPVKTKKWVVLLLILNLSIATYHSLIQFKILEDKCKVALHVQNPTNYMAALTKEKGCSGKSWELMGIPAPLLNAGASILLLGFTWRRSYLFR